MRKPGLIGNTTIILGVILVVAAIVVTSRTGQRSARSISADSGRNAPEPAATKPVEPSTQHCVPKIASVDYSRASSLRRIDFRNFTYPSVSGCDIDVAAETLHVRRGEFGDRNDGLKFRSLSFGDVTGDGQEEAIVTFAVETDGNMARDVVYVFTLSHQRPKPIYAFESGDRAQGGLRKVYAKDQRLIVELWGSDNTLEATSFSDGGNGLCCPRFFTRSRYRLNENDFHLDGSPEVLPNPKA